MSQYFCTACSFTDEHSSFKMHMNDEQRDEERSEIDAAYAADEDWDDDDLECPECGSIAVAEI